LGTLVILITVGIFGFMWFENETVLDALYLTTITISTVGFGLPHELTTGGKIFTIFLIIFSFGNYAYAISIITTHLVEGQIYDVLGVRKRNKGKNMKNHVIICGFGRNGRKVSQELKARGEEYIVIDQDHEVVMNYTDEPTKFIEGDATEDDVLEQAGIHNAKSIISTMPADADNLFVVLTARSLNPDIVIISRASNDSADRKLHVAGVDHVVMPESVGGAHMAKLVSRSDVLEFLDHLSLTGSSETNLEVIEYDELPDEFKNKSIMEMAVRQLVGANIVGFKTPKGEFIINPSPDTIIIPDSKIFILGTPEQIKKINLKKLAPDYISKELKKSQLHLEREYGLSVLSLVRKGKISAVVAQLSKEIEADLVVMGTHGKTGIQKITGSHAMKLIHAVHIPVLVVQTREVGHGYKKIIFPINVSVSYDVKIDWTIFIAKAYDAQVLLYLMKTNEEKLQYGIKKLTHKIVENFKAHNISYLLEEASSERNFPAQIQKFAAEKSGDLIMIKVDDDEFEPIFIHGALEETMIYNESQIPVFCAQKK